MINWFKEKAPIRRKFTTLLLIHGAIAAATVTSVFAVVEGWIALQAALGITVAAFIAHLIVVVTAKKLICDPFVVICFMHLLTA